MLRRTMKVIPLKITQDEIDAYAARRRRLDADRQRALVRAHPVLRPGSTVEFVYRHAVELIQGSPTAQFPEMGNGVAWMHDLQTVLMPLMPRLQDRNETRTCHYLAYLDMHGLLEIDKAEKFVTLPREEMQ